MPPAAPEKAAARLGAQLDEVARLVRFEPALLARQAERVSKWTIGLQVDHILKVLEAGQLLLHGAATPLPRGVNLTGRIVLALGWFPRGVARSPQRVLPQEQSPAELAGRISHLRRIYCETPLPAATFADPRPVFPHPFFGGLSALQGLRFLGIHTDHHLRIVADIRRST